MDESRIERINALARKAKCEGLNEEEKKEQAALRKEFLAAIRINVRTQLDNIRIVEADGSITNPGEEKSWKRKN